MEQLSSINKPQQSSTKTFRGRNLPLMRAVDQAFRNLPSRSAQILSKRRVLSFGCSDGAEILDLLEVMPDAEVVGCDINPGMLSIARQRCPESVTLLENPSELSQAGPFDAIFALNVLCNYPKSAGLDNVSSTYPFSHFDAAIEHLDSALHPGGFLVLYNAQYFFEDSKVGSRYDPNVPGPERNGWIEKASPSGDRVTSVHFNFAGREFDRPQWVNWIREPKNRETVESRRHELDYWHEWIGKAFTERSTQNAIWKKAV